MEEDVIQSCAKLAPGCGGVQFAFDTAGKQATLDQCVGSLRVGGTVVNLAIWGGSALIMPNAFTLGEKKYSGSAVYVERDFDEVISTISIGKVERLICTSIPDSDRWLLSAGVIDPGFMVASRIGLHDFVEHGLMKILQDPGSTVKILVDLAAEGTAGKRTSLDDARVWGFEVLNSSKLGSSWLRYRPVMLV
jgi:threonine dehydrogenase-like Zn-dependent dehydrogenase